MFNQCIKHCRLLVWVLLIWTSPVSADINVFACEPEWATLASELGGDKVKVYSATTAAQDPHHIQARPSLIAKARAADLLVCTGAELEVGWLPLLLRKSANPRIQRAQPGFFMAAEQVSLLNKPLVLDRSVGDVHGAGNPHIHLDPERLLQVAVQLSKLMGEMDSGNLDYYQRNLRRFTEQWQQAMMRWRHQALSLQGKAVVVHHDNWLYLEQWLGLTRVAMLEPKSGVPPTSRHLSMLLSQLEKTPADVIMLASYQGDKAARWLSAKTNAPVLALPFSVAEDEKLIDWFDRLLAQLLEVMP
jgi:zinc/manganese transport system substrate-binding protein